MDALSRNQLSLFSALAPQANLSTSSAGRALSRQMEKLLSRALAPSTFNTYQTGIRRYYDFCSTHHRKPLPGTARTLALFVTDLSMNFQPGTIQVYISAVSYLHHMNGHRSSASNNPMIKLLVQGVERSMLAAHLKPKRQPITNEMLGQMLSQLDRDHKTSHDRLMLKAAITLGFFGLLRVSELTVPNQHGFNPDQHLTTKDITMRKDSMVVVIKKSKTDQRGESCQINIGRTHTKCCPHFAMQRYLGQVTRSARKPLFLFESGTVLTARALRLVLHHLIRRCGYSKKLYNTHSLRIGAATAAARSGLPPAAIKNLSRWRSEAYKVYTLHPLTQPSDSAVIASAQ